MSREDFEGIKDHAKRIHAERVAKTPERIAYAIEQFEKNGIRYLLKNAETGHFHLFDKNGRLIQFWASTGKIQGEEIRCGIKAVIRMCKRRNE